MFVLTYQIDSVLRCSTLVTLYAYILTLTANEDLQLAEVHICRHWKLDDNVSMRHHIATTLQRDRGTQWNDARILATHVVIPQRGWSNGRRDVRQANDEVVGSLRYKTVLHYT